MKRRQWLWVVLIYALIVSACAAPAAPAAPAGGDAAASTEGEAAAVPDGGETFVGTPRNQTLIIDNLNGAIERPENFNPFVPGVEMGRGFHEICLDNLWEIDTTTGEQFGALADGMPTTLNDDYTSWEVKLRDGIYWDDGVQYTTADVEYMYNLMATVESFPLHGWYTSFIDSIEIVDPLTFIVNTQAPQPRITKALGSTIWDGTRFWPVAKHVWEQAEDVATFENNPPLCLGQYKFHSTDPNGLWTRWDLREDWERTSVGINEGKGGPQHLLWNFVGTEDKRILAMIANDVDILQDITPESMQVLNERSDVVRAWHDGFPYADFDDPCERGISFNNSEAPYDLAEVRWALALATDIKNVSLATFAGMMRVSPLGVPPVTAVQNVYHKPLVERLTALTLPDGYQPFDPNFAIDLAAILTEQGVGSELPTDEAELRDLFGIGWWKYDVDEAASLLESVGFTRDADGMWLLPDGTPWSIAINAPVDFEVQSGRLAFAVADSWSKFGIDATVNTMTAQTFWTAQGSGDFDAGSYWPGCAIGADIYPNLNDWHQKFILPTGEQPAGNENRHASDEIASLLDQLEVVPSDDPQNVELSKDLLMQMATEMHWIPMFGTSKFVPVNETYFQNFPTADNYYEGPWWWWSNFKYIVSNIEARQ